MTGFNPWIDMAIITGALAILAIICYVGDRHDKRQKSKLRGATRC